MASISLSEKPNPDQNPLPPHDIKNTPENGKKGSKWSKVKPNWWGKKEGSKDTSSSNGTGIDNAATATSQPEKEPTNTNVSSMGVSPVCWNNQPNPSSNFDEFKAICDGLDQEKEKPCLLSLAVFPENQVVKKKLLVYWWIGEGFLDPDNTAEELATRFLDNFTAKKLILPVNKKRKMVVNRFKMNPVWHSQVIKLAQEKEFFNYTSAGNLTWKNSGSVRTCLIKAEKLESDQNQERITTLFNANRRFLDFTFECFSKMKRVKVLSLGMWQSSAEHHHIEVENTEFLKGLKNMESLKFLSLQGISGIQELPKSISKLSKLKILNLRACYNLERLPKEIKSLKMLTHLDVSECYMLDHMPKELLSLSDLQVLKGFVITDVRHGNVCTLADIPGLKELRKLSINVNSEKFSIAQFSTTLYKFDKLEKLKIAWGGGTLQANRPDNQSNKKTSEAKSKPANINRQGSSVAVKNFARRPSIVDRVTRRTNSKIEMRTKLEKLELQCFPEQTLPDWLTPENLTVLKKLYIRGGGLTSLGKTGEWEVDVLHLKYLSELKINWSELKAIFPKLKYLEKFKCPKVTFCPCDGSGVWSESSTN